MNPKREKLIQLLKEYRQVIIAYSGGVDSNLLLKVAVDTLGVQNVVAATGLSFTYAEKEKVFGQEQAILFGARQIMIQTKEGENPNYTSNPADRCFYCKSELYDQIKKISEETKIPHILDGNNFDDTNDFRPGMDAAHQQGVISPLILAELTKKEIREWSKELNLSSWDKPAAPCLASRIPYGQEVTPDKLKMIEKAEEHLINLGFPIVRVRHHDNLARIEVPLNQLDSLCKERESIVKHLKQIGYQWVTFDLAGFKSGGFNDAVDTNNTRTA